MAIDLMSWMRAGALAKLALIGLACLLAVTAVLALRATAEAQSTISDGSFIRQAGTDDVYRVYIVNGKQYKWLILNQTAFASYGSPWGSVHDVSRSVMNQYTTSAYARLKSNSAVWYFTASGDSGTRQWLNMTPKEFEAAGLIWDSVYRIPKDGEFDQYRRGNDLTCLNYRGSCQPKVDIRSSSLTYDEGDRVSSRWVATVTDRDSALYASNITVPGLPSGLRASFDRSNGRVAIYGTLASGTAGTYRVTVSASDGRLSDDDTFQITVTPPPARCEVSNVTSSLSLQEGQRVSSQRVATVSAACRSASVSGLPSGLSGSFSSSSRRVTISGTLRSGTAGTYTARITARDGSSRTTRETFRIHVLHPPVVNIRSDLTYTEGDRVSSQRVATVSDQDTSLRNLNVRVTGLPSGLSGSFNTSNGRVTISGTLGTGLRRSYTATVSANDGTYTRTRTFRVQVTPPPRCEVSNVTSSLSLREGQRLSSQRVATVSTACRNASVTGLPSGLSGAFSSSNRQVTISGTLTSGSAGTYTATISANDGTRTRTATFRVYVGADPEITSLASPSVTTGSSVGSTRIATVRDRDTSLSSLNVRVSGLPSGLSHSFNTSNGHVTISGTAPSSAGTHTVTVTASDGVGSDRESLQVTVGQGKSGSFIRQSGTNDVYRVKIINGKQFKWLIVNWAAFDSYGVARNTIRNVSLSVMNQYTTSNLARHGSDSKVWRFTASGDSGTRQWLNLTPAQFEAAGFDWDAVHSLRTIDFNQYTQGTALTCADFNVCEPPPNQAPEITNVASLTLTQGVLSGWHYVATVTDPDTSLGQIDINLSGLPGNTRSNSVWSHTYDSATGRVQLSAALGGVATAGTYTATISASDGMNTTSKTFQVTVRPPPDNCEISGVTSPLSLREGQQVTSQRVAAVSSTCRNASVSGLPSGLSGSFSSSNRQVTISGAPASGSAGTYTATISANDGTRTATANFQITVAGQGCVITDGPAMSLGVGQAARNAHLATVSGCDLRNAQVQVAISPSGSGLNGSFNPSNGRVTISGTPGAAGAYQASVTATSSGRTASPRTIRIMVTGNPPPIVVTRGNFIFERGEDVGQLWVATVTDNEPLAPGNVWLDRLPSGLRKADYNAQNGRLRIEGRVSAQEGVYTVIISANDGTTITPEMFQITIGAGDCESLGTLATGEIKRVVGEWTSSDPEDHPDGDGQRYFDRCRFELASPATVAIELSSGAVDSSLTVAATSSPRHMQTIQHGSPSKPARASLTLPAGSYYIYAATLWQGHTGTYILRATIAEPPEFNPPEVGEITWQRGIDGTRQLPGASGGLTPYTYSLRTPSGDSAPEGMTFNADTRTLTGAPLGEVGRHRITYRVTDAMGFEAGQTFYFKIVRRDISDGSLIREEGTEDVYLVRIANNKQYKRRILNEQVFASYRFDWRAVRDVPAATMNEYATSKLAQLEGDPKVWQLEPTTGTRHWLNMTADQFAANHDVDSVYTMNRREFNEYEEGEVIQPCTDDRHTREEPLAPGETWTREGEWTSNDCVTKRTAYITDHIGHYRDIYSFQVSEAVEVTIDLESDDVGTYIHLLDNSGQLVQLTDASSDGNNAHVTADLESNETYWIRATTRELGTTGEYEITIAAGQEAAPGPPVSLTEDQTTQGEWDSGDCEALADDRIVCRNQYRFELAHAQTVQFKVDGPVFPTLATVQVEKVDKQGRRTLIEMPNNRAGALATIVDGKIQPSANRLVPSTTLEPGVYILTLSVILERGRATSFLPKTYDLTIAFRWVKRSGEVLIPTDDAVAQAARIYGPVLRLDGNEQFRPVPAEAMIENSWLMRFVPVAERIRNAVAELSSAVSVIERHLGALSADHPEEVGEKLGEISDVLDDYVTSVQQSPNLLVAIARVTREDAPQSELPDLPELLDLLGLSDWANKLLDSAELPSLEDLQATEDMFGDVSRIIESLIEQRLIALPEGLQLWTDTGSQMWTATRRARDVLVGTEKVLTPKVDRGDEPIKADDLQAHNTRDHYLDLLAYRPGGLGNSGEWKNHHKTWRATYDSTAYVHITEYTNDDEDWKSIQWWFFYLYNNAQNLGTATAWDHEGDWEAVTVWFQDKSWDEILADSGVLPTEVGWSAHGDGSWMDVSSHTHNCLPATWRYPAAFVASNNHPSFIEHGDKLKGDDFDGDGTLLTPEGMYETRSLSRFVNSDEGVPYNANSYEEYQVRSLISFTWHGWQGRWGTFVKPPITLPGGTGTTAWNGPFGPLADENKLHAYRPPSMIGWGEPEDVNESRCKAQGGRWEG